jgi:hypothetical protein
LLSLRRDLFADVLVAFSLLEVFCNLRVAGIGITLAFDVSFYADARCSNDFNPTFSSGVFSSTGKVQVLGR